MNEATKARYSAYMDALNKCSLLAQRDFATAWERLRLLPPEQCRDVLLELMQGIVPRYGDMAALAAAEYYEAERAASGWPADFAAELAEGVPPEQIEASTRYACGHLFEGSALEHDPELTAAYLAGKVDEYVKQGGRDTIVRNAGKDRRARYARIPDGNACDFCKMLGSRGFVYRSKRKAAQKESGGKYHPFCNCQVAVSFDPYVEKYQKGWTTVTRGYADDAEVVVPGRDGSYKLRDVDIDELFAEYQQMGSDFNKGSRYKSYTRGQRLSDDEFARAMERLDNATTLDELHEVGKAIVDSWPKDSGGMRDQGQWDELSRRARELEERLRKEETKGVSGGFGAVSDAWVNQFENERLWAECMDGSPFHKEGTPHGVSITGEEAKRLYGGKAHHTHTTEVGGTFGEDDLHLTADLWFSEHTVMDELTGIEYKLTKLPDATKESAAEFAREYDAYSSGQLAGIYDHIFERDRMQEKGIQFLSEEQLIEGEKMLKTYQHKWLKEHAKEYGYSYD